MNFSIALLFFASFLISQIFGSAIEWDSNGEFAVSSLHESQIDSDGLAILYAEEEPSSSQFLYSKLTDDPHSMPLVTVRLINEQAGIDEPMQAGFDAISQNCSCYWINAKDFGPRFDLPESKRYQLAFRADEVDIRSGYFGFMWNRNGSTEEKPKDENTTTPVELDVPKTNPRVDDGGNIDKTYILPVSSGDIPAFMGGMGHSLTIGIFVALNIFAF